MKTHLQDVQMVWVGGDLLYTSKAILDKVKPGLCEPMLVYGSQKKVCVKNTKLSGRGIGRATALALAQAGADIAVSARTTPEIEGDVSHRATGSAR